MARISSGRAEGTSATHATASSSAIAQASARPMPRIRGARAAAERREAPQSAQGSSRRNFATRASPFSSFTLASAFSTVNTAL